MNQPLPPLPVPGPLGQPHLFHLPAEYEAYEVGADPETCLHLPVEDCDHRTFRCIACCSHAT